MRNLLAAILVMLSFVLPAKAAKGPKSAMDSFRLEVYRDGKSAVYYLHKKESATTLYYRDEGESDGWYLSKVSANSIDGIARIYRKYKLASFPDTSFDEEDRARDRWMVEATFADGEKKDIIVYNDGKPGEDVLRLEEEIVSCIHGLLDQMSKDGWQCDRSKSTYGPDGKLMKRIDYAADGTVRGGSDALDPFATF